MIQQCGWVAEGIWERPREKLASNVDWYNCWSCLRWSWAYHLDMKWYATGPRGKRVQCVNQWHFGIFCVSSSFKNDRHRSIGGIDRFTDQIFKDMTIHWNAIEGHLELLQGGAMIFRGRVPEFIFSLYLNCNLEYWWTLYRRNRLRYAGTANACLHTTVFVEAILPAESNLGPNTGNTAQQVPTVHGLKTVFEDWTLDDLRCIMRKLI